jgi:uncharacterized protein YPO0396
MNDVKTRIDEMIDELKQERDELSVKLHLAKREASGEWEELEAKLAKLEAKARKLAGATAEASQDISAAARLLAGEIHNGFKKIARHF